MAYTLTQPGAHMVLSEVSYKLSPPVRVAELQALTDEGDCSCFELVRRLERSGWSWARFQTNRKKAARLST